jgi:hypothetical protein
MRTRLLAAVLAFGWSAGLLAGQAAGQSQPPTTPAAPMAGMGQDKAPAKNAAQPMDMCSKMCKCKYMGMDMSKCMKMGAGKSMGMDKTMDMSKPTDHEMKMGMDMGKEKSMNMGGMEMSKAAVRGGALKVTVGAKFAVWTPAALAALAHQQVTVYNEHAQACQTYSGVLLIDLLKTLGVADRPHGREFQFYLVAEGADGYKVAYSLAEVTPDVHDATVLVADSMDGKPLEADGALKLIATGEKRPARWVRGLVAVRVLPVE